MLMSKTLKKNEDYDAKDAPFRFVKRLGSGAYGVVDAVTIEGEDLWPGVGMTRGKVALKLKDIFARKRYDCPAVDKIREVSDRERSSANA